LSGAAAVLAALWLAGAGAGGVGDRLPEDPAEGAKAVAQWHAHMVREEQERKLHYDRNRIREHRAVVRRLVAARRRYDRAHTPAAVVTAQARMAETAADARRRMTAIDHWGVNSNLLGDYEAILEILMNEYPAALVAALHGDTRELTKLRELLDEHDKKVAAWLAEAGTSRDE